MSDLLFTLGEFNEMISKTIKRLILVAVTYSSFARPDLESRGHRAMRAVEHVNNSGKDIEEVIVDENKMQKRDENDLNVNSITPTSIVAPSSIVASNKVMETTNILPPINTVVTSSTMLLNNIVLPTNVATATNTLAPLSAYVTSSHAVTQSTNTIKPTEALELIRPFKVSIHKRKYAL